MSVEMDPITRQMLIDMLLGGSAMPIAGPGTYADGEAKQMTTAEQAKGVNLQQDRLQSLFDPRFAAMGAALGMPGGINYDQMVEQEAPAPPPVVLTPTFTQYSESQDPLAQQIAEAVNAGMPRAQVAQLIRTNVPDPDLAGDYTKDVDTIYSERAKATQAQADYDNTPQEKKLSPLEEMYRAAGLSSPLDQYDDARLDPTKDARQEGMNALAQQSTAADEAYRRAVKGDELANRYPGGFHDQRSAGAAGGAGYVGEPTGNMDRFITGMKDGDVPQAVGGAVDGVINLFGGAVDSFRREGLGHDIGGEPKPQPQPQAPMSLATMDPAMMPNLPRMNPQASQANIQKLLQERNKAVRATKSAHVENNGRNGYLAGARAATKGRTPLGDDMVNRQLLMRALGMG